MTPIPGPKYLQCRHFPMTLSHTDIDALRPGEWVTDDVIDFYFKYLKHKYFRNNKKYVYIPVTIANLLTERPVDSSSKHIKDLAGDANALDFETQCLKRPKSIRVAFLPIFGDDHWSLLVYRNLKHRPLPEFLHFNSHLNSTREHHTQCARTALINLLYVFRENDPSMAISKDSYKLVVKNCPQQSNGNDCGVYVCMNAYILSSRLSKKEREGKNSPLHAFVKRLSISAYSPPGRRADTLSFAEKNPEKDKLDQEELLWKVKDKDAVLPDDMRSYITNVIYSATYTRSASASL
ncbi:SUMO1 sentrin specific peptidase 8 [Coemansia sp. RSA 2711]|nr:SUMO1 sentrin specific peptidase 8 [Coemansia sp. RSA 2711]KAJ2368088.1 SUMO1 sentrin specific peptidase 8 [Coemansia sp. RSA 2611]